MLSIWCQSIDQLPTKSFKTYLVDVKKIFLYFSGWWNCCWTLFSFFFANGHNIKLRFRYFSMFFSFVSFVVCVIAFINLSLSLSLPHLVALVVLISIFWSLTIFFVLFLLFEHSAQRRGFFVFLECHFPLHTLVQPKCFFFFTPSFAVGRFIVSTFFLVKVLMVVVVVVVRVVRS